jgi:hypothetical protein
MEETSISAVVTITLFSHVTTETVTAPANPGFDVFPVFIAFLPLAAKKALWRIIRK